MGVISNPNTKLNVGINSGGGPPNKKTNSKDKYNELKTMYDDLLERHYALAASK
jgi:hypothetical protein